MRTFIENYLHFMKNCIRPHYEKLKPLKSGFIENLIFENNRDPWYEGGLMLDIMINVAPSRNQKASLEAFGLVKDARGSDT